MTGNKFLLDTSIIIEVFNGNKVIADKINDLGEIYISTIVLGELYTGINRVANKSKHLKKLDDFLKLCTIIETDSTTSKFYGACMADLYKKGKPIPTNDVWIAAIAIQHEFTLITADKHYSEIDRLSIKSW